MTEIKPSRRRVARIRCVKECVDKFKDTTPLPASLCYVADELLFASASNVKVTLYAEPDLNASVTAEVKLQPSDRFTITGEEFCNSQGQWARVIKVTDRALFLFQH